MRHLLLLLVIAVTTVYGQFELEGGLTATVTEPIEVTVGDQFSMRCNADTLPAEGVVWKHNGMPVEESRYGMEAYQGEESAYSSLTAFDVSARDAGAYECTDPADYFNKASFRVIVNEEQTVPSVDIIEPAESNSYARSGESVTLRCEAPESVSITWSLNHEDITNSDDVVIDTMVNVHTHKQISALTVSASMLGVENLFFCAETGNSENLDRAQILVMDEPDEEGHDGGDGEEEEEEEEEAEEEDGEHGECAANVGALEEEVARLRSAIQELCNTLPHD